jgi:hypothetical protein
MTGRGTMSDRSMKELINRWKEKAKRKGAENRKLRKHLKQLTKKFNQAKEELQKYKNLTNGTKATQRKPAKEEKKSPKDTGSN